MNIQPNYNDNLDLYTIIFRNIINLLKARKCNSERLDFIETIYSLEEFSKQMNDSEEYGISFSITRKFNDNNILTIIFILKNSTEMKKKTFITVCEKTKDIINLEEKYDLYNVILVIPRYDKFFKFVEEVNNIKEYGNVFNGKEKKRLEAPYYECFSFTELSFNILEHKYVPEHILLEKEESKKIIEKYSLNISQLPRIYVSDPVIRFIGGMKGSIVKIIRTGYETGISIYLRIIISKAD